MTTWIDNAPDVDALCFPIANLIGRLIAERRNTLDSWERQWFTRALAGLCSNYRSNGNSTEWLRIVLVSLETALVPQELRSERKTDSSNMGAMTTAQLLVTVRALGCTVNGSEGQQLRSTASMPA